MEIKIKYSASSNISYRGTWTLQIDDDEWEEMNYKQRDEFIQDGVQQEIENDIEWEVMDSNLDDDDDE